MYFNWQSGSQAEPIAILANTFSIGEDGPWV